MAQLTRKAIIDCTVMLAQKKPVNKITVRDIVEECGITRNTFYYHFHDIYDVLSAIIIEKIDAFVLIFPFDSKRALDDLITFAVSFKKVMQNIYRAVGYEQSHQFLQKKLHEIFMRYLEKTDPPFSQEDAVVLSALYEEALFGVLVRWLRDDRYQDIDSLKRVIDRVQKLFNEHLKQLSEKASHI